MFTSIPSHGRLLNIRGRNWDVLKWETPHLAGGGHSHGRLLNINGRNWDVLKWETSHVDNKVGRSPVSRHSVQSYITYSIIRKREPLIALGSYWKGW